MSGRDWACRDQGGTAVRRSPIKAAVPAVAGGVENHPLGQGLLPAREARLAHPVCWLLLNPEGGLLRLAWGSPLSGIL